MNDWFAKQEAIHIAPHEAETFTQVIRRLSSRRPVLRDEERSIDNIHWNDARNGQTKGQRTNKRDKDELRETLRGGFT